MEEFNEEDRFLNTLNSRDIVLILRLARHYRDGAVQVDPDAQKALQLFVRAAELEDAETQNLLGCMYEEGECAPVDLEKAKHWFRAAAEQGHEYGQFNTGRMHERRGTNEDLKIALEWYRKAASQGHEFAREYARDILRSRKNDPQHRD